MSFMFFNYNFICIFSALWAAHAFGRPKLLPLATVIFGRYPTNTYCQSLHFLLDPILISTVLYTNICLFILLLEE